MQELSAMIDQHVSQLLLLDFPTAPVSAASEPTGVATITTNRDSLIVDLEREEVLSS